MTLYGWGAPRHFPHLPPPVERVFDIVPGTRILAHCHWQPAPRAATTLLLLHGLNGSSDAHYMRGIADKAFAQGMNVIRLNQRNCGGTEHMSDSLFHSGLTHDPRAVIEELIAIDGLERIAVAGYSLGGNLALKLAGEYGSSAPRALVAVAAVSPIMEISPCVRALERRSNWIYQWNFVRNLKSRMRRKEALHPGRFNLLPLDAVRTIRAFDEFYTAPHFGFMNAEDYYHRASAMRVVDRIGVPALVISAEDDPFVPPAPFRSPSVTGNPHITVVLSPHGGHCGFIGRATDGDDGYWAERAIVSFVAERARDAASAAARTPAPSPLLHA